MEPKILVVLAVIGAILLFGLVLAPLVEETPPVEKVLQVEEIGRLIQTGNFVVEQVGVPVAREKYTLFFSPAEGAYILLSEVTLTVGEQTIPMTQRYSFDSNFTPILYHLTADTPSEPQIISAKMGPPGLQMEVRIGDASHERTIPEGHNIAILDNNLMSHLIVLLMAYRAGMIENTFTAAVPQRLLALPSRLTGPVEVRFTSGEAGYEGDLYTLHLGDLRIDLLVHHLRLVGVFLQAQAIRAYNVDLFPNGIVLEIEAATTAPAAGEEEVSFVSEGVTLAGTLILPEGATAPVPAVLFIHGSGPIDRDGNAMGVEIDTQRQLAHALAETGIGSLRYDKRGVGASEGTFTQVSKANLLADVRTALTVLRAAEGIDPERIFLVGHSEGGRLASIIAAEGKDIAGIVLIAAPASPLYSIIRGQVERANRAAGLTGEDLEMVLVQQDQFTAFVKGSAGEWPDYTFEDLQGKMPWLTTDQYRQMTALSLAWLRQHFRHDQTETLRRVTSPVLIIQGEKDSQVLASEADILAATLAEAGNTRVTVEILPNLNHLLRYHPEEPNLINRHLYKPVDPRVIETVIGWIGTNSAD
ncbi:alpha/beta fold hydrolase [Candidatus Bipolaricaulota bacterium]|nr:alpha/beta fold hydrolase [Candidatus Bipolaricaulota bacterium]